MDDVIRALRECYKNIQGIRGLEPLDENFAGRIVLALSKLESAAICTSNPYVQRESIKAAIKQLELLIEDYS